MAWLRIDDRVRTHPKIAQAGPAAAWLWFCGICYCREHLTDGDIPKAVVPSLAMNLPSPWKHAARLVDVRLWEQVPDGYRVHDFLKWNPSKADVVKSRQSEVERKRSERSVSGRTNAGVREMSSCVRAGDAGLGLGLGLGLGSEDLTATEEIPISTVPPRWGNSRADRRESLTAPESYHRKNCAGWAYAACQAGLCVPKYLWPQWERRKPTDALQTFVAAWAVKAEGDTAEKFWPAAFEAHFGSSAPAASKGDKTTRIMSAAERIMARHATDVKAVGSGT